MITLTPFNRDVDAAKSKLGGSKCTPLVRSLSLQKSDESDGCRT